MSERQRPTPRLRRADDASAEPSAPEQDAPLDEPSSSPEEEDGSDEQTFSSDLKRAIVGGTIATAVALIGTLAVGHTSGAEGQHLVQSMLPTTRAFTSTAMIASATILALMLTLLSLSANANSTLKPIYYRRIRHIALVDVSVFIAATLFLLLLNLPLERADKVPMSLYSVMYYANVIFSAALGGAIIAIVLMLYHTVRDMIRIVGPVDGAGALVAEEDEEAR